MYVTYFDEVKTNPEQGQHTYYVGGIAVPIQHISAIENKVSELAKELFGSVELKPSTEFHAAFVYHGKGPFKGMQVGQRIEILRRLAEILAGEDVKRIYSAIDSRKLYVAGKAAEFAFAHFCERVQMLVGNDHTILIGDLDDESMGDMIQDFSQYRAQGTPWSYGIEIKSIVDSVHFAHSHHSRLIQLADAYLFLLTHSRGDGKGGIANGLAKALEGIGLYAHRYKEWPG